MSEHPRLPWHAFRLCLRFMLVALLGIFSVFHAEANQLPDACFYGVVAYLWAFVPPPGFRLTERPE